MMQLLVRWKVRCWGGDCETQDLQVKVDLQFEVWLHSWQSADSPQPLAAAVWPTWRDRHAHAGHGILQWLDAVLQAMHRPPAGKRMVLMSLLW
jgi:hypothetical protein